MINVQYYINSETGQRRLVMRHQTDNMSIPVLSNIPPTSVAPLLRLLLESSNPSPQGDMSLTQAAEALLSLDQTKPRDTPVTKYTLQHLEMTEARTEDTCSVCQCNYTDGEQCIKLPCGHHFHRDCIKPWFKQNNTCPICRVHVRVPIDQTTAAHLITKHVRAYLHKMKRYRQSMIVYNAAATTIQSLARVYNSKVYYQTLKQLAIRPDFLDRQDPSPQYCCTSCDRPSQSWQSDYNRFLNRDPSRFMSPNSWRTPVYHYLQVCQDCGHNALKSSSQYAEPPELNEDRGDTESEHCDENYECEHGCGFIGSYDTVRSHEQMCHLRSRWR